ncbi:hypothetical protein [Phormidium tenue]|uniref:Integrase n=1 Tax=Phormidium tenue NIES-30 TaxID=549789 RepID=A0A1U7J009_9CYAN|nr:hypothetical protein [Phormidium tenue]MBD2234087.1 hypothetical protein [Phormidium tenue FACHB-1052]OKH44673.1 hypothetical protein NIES30_21920 [Phormidium tenue NIES-30]
MEDVYYSRQIKTVGAAFRAYSLVLSGQCATGDSPRNTVSLARTAVIGYTVPGWGGPSRQGDRITPSEVEAAQRFLYTLPLDQLNQALKAQSTHFEAKDIDSKIQKANRYQLSKFIAWVQDQGWLDAGQVPLGDEVSQPAAQVYRHSFNIAKERGKQPLKNLGLTKRVRRPDFGLKPDEVNDRLRVQIDAVKQFEVQSLNHRPATINSNVSFLMRMLGWQHRYGLVPLEDLSLTGLVPYTPLNVSMESIQAEGMNEEEAWQKLLMRREQRKELAEQQARVAERVWDDYFVFYRDAPDSQVATLQALIIVAKYFYRETENTASKSGYTDIPVVRRLRQKLSVANKLRKSKPPEIAYKERSVSWETVLDVLDAQQAKYEERFYYSVSQRNGKPHRQRKLREPTAIACDLQLVLVLCILSVMAPERNRTICELEMGRTLMQGSIEDGVLVPIENMARPELAQWHLYLGPKDYKTGEIYGKYLTPIDNMQLARGQTFYGLLQTWIDTYRPLFNPAHNQLFVKVKTTMGATPGEPITHQNLTSWVKYLFYRHVGVPVVPQSLRKMYVTYLKRSRASEAELEAAARAMHHSRAMQSRQYDEQDLQDKIAPISAFNQQLFKQVFSAQDAAELPLTADGQLRLRDLSEAQIKALSQQLRQENKRRQQDHSAA